MKLHKIALTPPIVAISVVISAALGAQAEVLEVGEGKTYSDIASAVGAAKDYDTVLVYDGVYEITAQIEVTKPITLKSANGAAVTTIRRINVDVNAKDQAQRVLYVNNAQAVVKGFTMTGGQVWNSVQTVSDANRAFAYGAGVFIDSEGGTLDSCVLRENRVCYWACGGGVAALGASAVITNCTSCENSCVYGYSGAGTPKGLGAYLKDGATLVDSLVSSNNVASTTYCDAAGVYASAGTVRRTRICYNRSRFSRVGFISTGASVFEDVLVDRNLSQDETNGGYGAGGVDGGVTTFLRCTFADNCSPKTGGGLNLGSTKSVFTDCILQDNGCLDDLTSNWTGTAAVFSNCLSNSTFPESAVGCRTGLAVFADDWAGDYRVAADSPGYEIGARACAYGADACAILDLSETAVPGSTLSFSGVVHCAGEAEVLCRWSADGGATWTDYGPSAAFALSVAEVGEKTIAFQAKVGGVERSVVTKTVRVAPEGIEVSTVEELVQAVKDARGGTTITVADGIYELSDELVLDEAVVLVSANGAAVTTLKRLTSSKEWTTQRCLVLNHPKARVEGFTITGGLAQWSYAPGWKEQRGSGVLIAERGGTLASCVVKDNKSIYWVRGAVAAYGPDAVVTNCDIVLNKATYGNGIGRVFGCGVAACQGARVTHSRIDDNNTSSTAYLYGGGVFLRNAALSHCRVKGNKSSWPAGGLYATGDSTVDNCLFARNISTDKGGGAYVEGASAFVNCTFWGNSASAGGGVRIVSGTPTFLNCLFAQNGVSGTAADGDPDWSGSASATTFANCLVSVKVPDGSTGCQVGDAKLEDPENGDFTPKDVSLAVDNGSEETPDVPAFDYAGAERVSGRRIDIGCCEFQMPEYTLSCEVGGGDSIVGSDLTLTAFVRTVLEGTVYCRWSFDGGQTWTTWSDELSTWHTFDACGEIGYLVQVMIGDREMPPAAMTTRIAPTDIYLVAPEQATGAPTAPYDTPQKAATSFGDAMEWARSGTTVHVGPGTYEIAEELVLEGNTKIVSDAGAAVTTVRRILPTGTLGDGEAARVIRMDAEGALVRGLTITGGKVRYVKGANGAEKYAGGVLIGTSGGTLADCIVTGNTVSGNAFGGGLAALGPAVITNCEIKVNIGAYESGGPTPTGGGAYLEGGATLVDCEISDNEATRSGDFQRCHGAGVAVGQFGATLIRCKVTGNVAGRYVNGAGLCVKGTPFLAENCLFAKNSGSTQTAGGGVYANVAATFVNCTIAGNQAATGGGVHATAAAKFVNCIVIGNQVLADTTAGAPEWNGASAIYRYCLSTKAMTAGSSDCRVAATANFTDEANGDYTLTVSSDARDHGLDHPAEGDSEIDLAHESRYSGKAIDIGCYELQMASFLSDFTWTAERSVAGAPFSFRADVVTEEEGEILCRWSFDGGANWTDWSASREATTSFGSLGYHTVSLQAKVGDTEHEAVSHDVFVSPAEVYLADVAQHPDVAPEFPYASSETAATNVHDVMTVAGGGTVVHVAPGTYEITNCVWLTSPIEIVGDEGAEKTVFVRRRAFPRGTLETEQRCFRLSHPQAKLKGLAITGGDIHFQNGLDANAGYGAGVYIDAAGGTLDSCTVTNCYVHYLAVGGGVAVGGVCGVVTNCVIRDNIAHYGSGGFVPKAAGVYVMGGATVVDTLIAGNHPDQGTDWCQCTGGGVYMADGGGTILRCVITNNSSGCNYAAGVCLGNAAARLVKCLVVGNYQIKNSGHACRGGGVMIGTGTVGAEGAAAINCTIVGNTAGELGGGVYGNTGSYQNCIIQDNALVSGDTSVEWGSEGQSFLPTFVACLCPEKLPEKVLSKPLNYVGRIDFAEERPYDVPYQSAAHNKGVIAPYEEYLVGGTDLYGRPRIVSRKVDIGCTECQIRPGLMLQVK